MPEPDRPPAGSPGADGDRQDAVVLHLPEGSGRFSPHALHLVRTGFAEAVRLATAVLDVSGVDVAAVDAPQMAIPGWGCGGYTYGPHTIVLALDPQDEGLTLDRVRATVVHELHHVARERGPGCGTSLRERIVSEGLAMLFEEQILGSASEFAHQDISNIDIARAVAVLDQDPADEGLWFFHTGDVPLWFGYTLGYRWTQTYASSRGAKASDLAQTPAVDLSSPS